LRQVVLDTETTGLEAAQGHRIIEIGCVEMLNRRATGRHFHEYLDPERDIDSGAAAVRFAQVAERFLEFVDGAELIIHNAPFDVAFLDSELMRWASLSGAQPVGIRTRCRVLDTLALAREMHPGQRNGLDALCKRYSIDNSHRALHGALLDARILADVYLAMTGGQNALTFEEAVRPAIVATGVTAVVLPPRVSLRVVSASHDEIAAHEEFMKLVQKASGGKALWQ
jgi:DNA polymerase-3 subunit epsilon